VRDCEVKCKVCQRNGITPEKSEAWPGVVHPSVPIPRSRGTRQGSGLARSILVFIGLLLLSCYVEAATYTVKAGGGGDFTTIQGCANVAVAGDTCTVYAGTYNEHVSLSAGGVGAYKTLQVNGTDAVYVFDFTISSHNKIIGFHIQNPSSPATNDCVAIGTSATDIYITNNNMYACGNYAMISVPSAPYASYVYVQGNTLSWSGSTTGGTNVNYAILMRGDHWLVENNDISHVLFGTYRNGSYGVVRNNTYHDTYGDDPDGTLSEHDCTPTLSSVGSISGTTVTWSSGNQFSGEFPGTWVAIGGTKYTISAVGSSTSMTLQGSPPSGSQTLTGGVGGYCHTDFFFAEPNSATQYNLVENNTITNNLGHDAKGFLAQGDSCSGNCSNVIIRFNVASHFGAGMVDNELANGSNVGFSSVKVYNNTYADTDNYGLSTQLYGGTAGHSTYATYAAELNNLYYYPFSLASFNPYYFDATALTGASYGYNLAWCTGSPCSLHGHVYSIGNFTDDAGNFEADPLFVNYSSNNFQLASGSPAIGAGTYLTKVASTDSGSGTSLTVDNAGFFQDGYGIPNVNADCISVKSAKTHVCITAVNYQTNTLTLASGISRAPGDSVWLYSDSTGRQVLFGNAPNIGATFDLPASPTGLTAVAK
jgi:hypothetical protein